jgi:hypothetical protein
VEVICCQTSPQLLALRKKLKHPTVFSVVEADLKVAQKRKEIMSALTILIIRHAEKTGEIWPGPGLTPEGVVDEKSLVIRGWQRAGSWAVLFGTDLGGLD